jgi:hypothetical protein
MVKAQAACEAGPFSLFLLFLLFSANSGHRHRILGGNAALPMVCQT